MWSHNHWTGTGICYPDSPIDKKKNVGNSLIIPFIPLLASQEGHNVHLGKVTSLNQESKEQMQLDNVWQVHNDKDYDIPTQAPTIKNTVAVVEIIRAMCNDIDMRTTFE